MDFNNLYRRHIMARMREANLIWYGWHAFRSGLASNLSELGAPDNVIQQIPRHGDLGTTQKFYRKTRRPAVAKAMKKLSN
jgi:integrase